MRATVLGAIVVFCCLVTAGCLGGGDGFGDADADTDADTDGDTDADTDTGPDDCDLLSGDPCPDGQNCATDMSNDHFCVSAGEGGQDAGCGTSADCQRGFHCDTGTCRRWCTAGGTECDADGAVCTTVVMGSDGETEIGRVCKTPANCDVLAQDCDGGLVCFVVRTDGITDCGNGGAGGQGAACTYLSDCRAGYQCDADVCKQYCNDDGGDPSCAGGATCRGQGFDTPGGVAVGYCE